MKTSTPIYLPSVFLYLLFCAVSFGQKSTVYTGDASEFQRGLELYDKQKYGAAQKQFGKVISDYASANSELRINSEYYSAICAMELFHKDAEYLFTQFIQHHPESPKVKSAYFQLGRYNYRKKNWLKVIEWLNGVDVFGLSNEDVPEYYFKLGYAYFMEKEYDKASDAFYEIKEVETEYSAAAKYYFSHIAYHKGNYETALTGFRKLEGDAKFGPIVPYYIAQVLYLQGKYDEVIGYAPPLLDSVEVVSGDTTQQRPAQTQQYANTKRGPEIARIIGESYYHIKHYKEAIPYLEKYKTAVFNIPRQDSYQLAYAYYQSSEYDKAIKIFKQLTVIDDSLAQICFYHVGDCYIKRNEKKFAINAFKAASQMSYDRELQQDALFSFAKLSYDVSFDPYMKAVDAFWEYYDKYPNSGRRDEVLTYLVNMYLSAKNYKAAMISLEALKQPEEHLQRAHQFISYNLGVDHFINGYYQHAIANFKKSQTYPIDKDLNSLSHYWTGEAYYRLNDYDNAITGYNTFIYQPRAILQKEFNTAHYNIGYASFKKKNYKQAIEWFRKYTASTEEKDSSKLSDAHLRIADSYYVIQDYYNALDYYDKSLAMKGPDADYSLLQKAMALGLLKKQDEKISTLESLLYGYRNSTYTVDATYQLAQAFTLKDNNDRALELFNKITNEYPNSSYVKKSLLNIAQIHFNKGSYDLSLGVYKSIVSNYPNFEDSRLALEQIRTIYTRINNVDEFETYIKGLTFVNFSQALLDSTSYEAPYLKYVEGNCEKAVDGFRKYLEKFSDGIYSVSAQFYKAECEYNRKHFEEALTGYNHVINKPVNKFTETALLKASRINFQQKNFDEALSNYIMLERLAEYKSNVLEARTGLMRCFFYLRNFDAAIDYANKVLISDKVQESVVAEAHFIGGKSALELGYFDVALKELSTTAELTVSEMGSEAKYFKAYIFFSQQNYAETEREIFELVNKVPAHDYWIAKALLLLADVYVANYDAFQAKHTLQSIIDNYDGLEILSIAKEKLKAITNAESQIKERKIADEIEVEFNAPDSTSRKLFEEPDFKDGKKDGDDL